MGTSWLSRAGRRLLSSHKAAHSDIHVDVATDHLPHPLPRRTREETEALEKERDARWRAYVDSGRVVEDPRLDELLDVVLKPGERFWRDTADILEKAGYRLRPRYMPGWRPSWEGTEKSSIECEDSHSPFIYGTLIDAVRISDNLPVMLKRIDYIKLETKWEQQTMFAISSNEWAFDPQNYSVRILDLINIPGDDTGAIMVLPFLRSWNNPQFETIGEAVDFFRQVFDGLHFFHQKGLAHRDCHLANIMMDARPMYPDGWHPVAEWSNLGKKFFTEARYFSRTQRPPRYYIIDLGISGFFDTNWPAQDLILRGGDRTCPEHLVRGGYPFTDPFPTDVYYLGNVIRENFVQRKKGFEFIAPLVDEMTHPDPRARPTIGEVVRRFHFIQSTLSTSKLRSRVVPLRKHGDRTPVGLFTYWRHRILYTLTGTPAIPSPRFS